MRSIIQLAQSLGAKTIAEGVETQLQAEFLVANGCDYLQGYFFDRPMLLEDLIQKYSSNKK